jgi:hypothetical protein
VVEKCKNGFEGSRESSLRSGAIQVFGGGATGQEDSGLNVRPHPGPLPQERENRKSVAGGENIVGGRGSSVNGERLVAATAMLEESESVDGYPLSPGERDRVRASVSPYSAFLQ